MTHRIASNLSTPPIGSRRRNHPTDVCLDQSLIDTGVTSIIVILWFGSAVDASNYNDTPVSLRCTSFQFAVSYRCINVTDSVIFSIPAEVISRIYRALHQQYKFPTSMSAPGDSSGISEVAPPTTEVNTSDAPPQSGSFKFVVIERPTDAKSRGYRKQVRSHVTSLQHRRAREDAEAAVETARLLERRIIDGGPVAIPRVLKGKGRKRKRNGRPAVPRSRSAPDLLEATTSGSSDLVLPSSPLAKSFSQGTAAFRTFALHDPMNDVGRNLESLNLNCSSVMVSLRPSDLTRNARIDDVNRASTSSSSNFKHKTSNATLSKRPGSSSSVATAAGSFTPSSSPSPCC